MAIAQKQNGTWYVQYRIPGVKSPQKDCFEKGEMGRMQAKQRDAEIKTGHFYSIHSLLSKDNIYLDELGQCYLDIMRTTGKTEGWRRTLVYLLNEHFLPFLNHIPVNQLTFQDIVKVASRFDSKSPATQNRYMDSLHAIFNFGIKHSLTLNDPMKYWEKRRERKKNISLTVEDLGKLHAAAPEHLKWILEVEWELGTRPGNSELFKLKWTDINFSDSLIHIRGSKTQTSDRLIPLTPAFKKRLLEKKAIAQSEFVIEYRGKRISHCRTSFAAACKKAGITYQVRLYDIRHLFASAMLVNGGDLKAVSRLLGHSSTRMTADTYYHELEGEKLRALSVKPQIPVQTRRG